MAKLAIAIPTSASRAELRQMGLRLAKNARQGRTFSAVLIEFQAEGIIFTYHVGRNRTLTDLHAGTQRVAERLWRQLWPD